MKPVAILSSPVLVFDGEYRIETLVGIPDITNIPHYIGHPSTKAIVEELGAIKAPTNIFLGLDIGQQAVCFTLKNGFGSRKTEGITVNQEATMQDLQVRLLTRVK